MVNGCLCLSVSCSVIRIAQFGSAMSIQQRKVGSNSSRLLDSSSQSKRVHHETEICEEMAILLFPPSAELLP